MSEDENYLKGVKAAQDYYNSRAYAGLSRAISAEDAAKIFLPPVDEMLSQMSTPLPKPRANWLKGFKEEQMKFI